jgi:predicted DNA repair protein MutK
VVAYPLVVAAFIIGFAAPFALYYVALGAVYGCFWVAEKVLKGRAS